MAPLRPAVVTLDAGTTVRRALIGLTPEAYARVRLGQGLDSVLLAVRAQRIQGLLRDSLLGGQQQRVLADELRRCRTQGAGKDADYAQLAALARACDAQPKARPLLLDGHTYLGAGAGALGLLLLSLFLH